MPYYDFQCAECRKRFTERLTFDEHDRRKRVKCPKCGSRKTRRQLVRSFVAQTSKKS